VRQIKTFNQFYSENETNLQRNQRRQGNNEVNGTESRTVKRMSSESRTLKRKRSTKSQWNERNHRAVESQSEGSCSWNHPAEKCSQMYDLLNHEENELLTKSSSCWIKKRRDLLNHEWNKRNHGEKGSVESRMEQTKSRRDMIFTKRRYMIFTITKRFCLICSLKSEKQNECGKLKVKLGFSSNSSLKSEGKQKWK
jgi:hypothetical protein